jgi:HEPN domain-containing protein
MNEVVKEWVDKAESDFLTASREFAADKQNYDAVCFHAQQCVEKYMKALLIIKGRFAPKTHDLAELAKLVEQAVEQWGWPVEELRLLTRAAVIYRYPGESAEREETSAALEICRALRENIKALLEI